FQVLRFVNTDRAYLSGAELYGEYDLTCWLTPFATMAYVYGRDQTRDRRGANVIAPNPGSLSPEETLPGIPPLDTRLGLRFHEAAQKGQAPKWGLETTARIVADANDVAASLGEVGTPGFTVYDIRAFWQANKHLLLTTGVENVGNKNYREH